MTTPSIPQLLQPWTHRPRHSRRRVDGHQALRLHQQWHGAWRNTDAAAVVAHGAVWAALLLVLAVGLRLDAVTALGLAAVWPWRRRRDTTSDVMPLIDPDERRQLLETEVAQLRAQLDRVRAERAMAEHTLTEQTRINEDLLRALTERRPAPDPTELGKELRDQWLLVRPPEINNRDRWRGIAELAIDRVRFGWPLSEVEQSESVKLHDPADTAQIGDDLGEEWVRAQNGVCRGPRPADLPIFFPCTRSPHETGNHVATLGAAGRVVAVWPQSSPGGDETRGDRGPAVSPAPGDPTRIGASEGGGRDVA